MVVSCSFIMFTTAGIWNARYQATLLFKTRCKFHIYTANSEVKSHVITWHHSSEFPWSGDSGFTKILWGKYYLYSLRQTLLDFLSSKKKKNKNEQTNKKNPDISLLKYKIKSCLIYWQHVFQVLISAAGYISWNVM